MAGTLKGSFASCSTVEGPVTARARISLPKLLHGYLGIVHRPKQVVEAGNYVLRASTLTSAPDSSVTGDTEASISEASAPGDFDGRESTIQESLVVLEWPALCKQVAAFASTAMAAQRILKSGLPLGQSKVGSMRQYISCMVSGVLKALSNHHG